MSRFFAYSSHVGIPSRVSTSAQGSLNPIVATRNASTSTRLGTPLNLPLRSNGQKPRNRISNATLKSWRRSKPSSQRHWPYSAFSAANRSSNSWNCLLASLRREVMLYMQTYAKRSMAAGSTNCSHLRARADEVYVARSVVPRQASVLGTASMLNVCYLENATCCFWPVCYGTEIDPDCYSHY